MVTVLVSPTFIPATARSKPGTTWPLPRVNSSGVRSRDESNSLPSARVPV
jgi:hypothetical protein